MLSHGTALYPPTLLGRAEQLPSVEWDSKGAAFEMFVARMKSLVPNGFRTLLWHQGESDANQKKCRPALCRENFIAGASNS